MSMLVSAIIPTFNRASTIAAAIESVLGQTYRDIEVIVVDDGSTDSTEKVLCGFADRITVIRQPNAGPSAARNAGLRAARGDVIAFLDSDDLWLPDKVEQQVRVLSAAGDDVVCCVCNATVLDESGIERTSFDNAGLTVSVDRGYWMNPSEVLMTRFLLFNQVAAIRREALEKVGGFKENLHLLEDYDMAVRLSMLGSWGIIKKALVIKHNDTGGIGVVAMRDHNQRLPACADALRSLLADSSNWSEKIKNLLKRALRNIESEIRLAGFLSSDRRPVRLLGRLGFAVLRLQTAARRRLPGWPEADVIPIDCDSIAAP